MTTDRTYYNDLKRRYLAAEKAALKKYKDPDFKFGDDILLEENPSNPSELRQYVEVICVFADEIGDDILESMYQDSTTLLKLWKKEQPGNSDLKLAKAKLKIIKRQIRKNKSEDVKTIMIIVLLFGGFIAALIIFPKFASFVKTIFFIEFFKELITSMIPIF